MIYVVCEKSIASIIPMYPILPINLYLLTKGVESVDQQKLVMVNISKTDIQSNSNFNHQII